MPFIQFLGSLTFAIFLIIALTIVLIVSTSMESAFGTPFAQKLFYQAGWFDVLLFLLAVNILCSTVLRWPFKKRHTGFIVTHIGLLLLLAGSLVTRFSNVDGQMMLMEGQSGAEISENKYELLLHGSGGGMSAVDLVEKPVRKKRKLGALGGGFELRLEQVWTDAVEVSDLVEGKDADPANHAAVIELKSERVGARESLRLVEHDPDDPSSAMASMGPAVIELKKEPVRAVTAPALRVLDKNSKTLLSFDPSKARGTVEVAGTELKISDIRYFPNARVGEENKLISISDEPLNPAVEFTVEDGKGGHWHMARFALFPEFESMHEMQQLPAVRIEFSAPQPAAAGPSLTLYYGDGKWSYGSRSSSGQTQGSLEEGKTYSTGWMDFSFTVENLMDHAKLERRMRHGLGTEKGHLAAEAALVKDGRVLEKRWVTENRPATFAPSPDRNDRTAIGPRNVGRSGDGVEAARAAVLLRTKSRAVPFELTLKDFRKVDYPGTSRPASFESDVVMHDAKENLKIEKTISMNKPLDYKGFRIFQTSYIQDPSGEASVFTVAKNPGIPLIYGGAIVMFLGIYLTFFVPWLSSFKHD